jgi:hypothetical protein
LVSLAAVEQSSLGGVCSPTAAFVTRSTGSSTAPGHASSAGYPSIGTWSTPCDALSSRDELVGDEITDVLAAAVAPREIDLRDDLPERSR